MLPNHAPLVVAEHLARWRRSIQDELISDWDALLVATFQTMRALRRDLQQSGDDSPLLLENYRPTWDPRNRGKW